MGLILPPFSFANCTDNLTGTPPTTIAAPGTAFSSSATANTDGSAVSVLSALAHDVHYLVVGLGMNTSPAGLDNAALIDVLADPAGGTSWGSFIDDLVGGYMSAFGAGGGIGYFQKYFHFPVFIKAGTSLGARARFATANAVAFRMGLWAYGNPSRPEMWWCGSKVESLGIGVAGASKGTSITPGSTTGTMTWTNVGGVTSGRYGAVQFEHNSAGNNATVIGYYMQLGIGGAQVPGTPTMSWTNGANENSAQGYHWGPIWCDIPQGTQLQIGACASGTAQAHDVAIYGVH